MFAPKGWISLKDVYEYFVWYFSENDTIGGFTFTGDEGFELTWYFANEAKEVAVCGPHGEAIPASRGLVEYENECDNMSFHVNLYLGTVGSESILETENIPFDLKDMDTYLNLMYGPFRYLPIIFRRDDFEDYLERLANDSKAQSTTTEDAGSLSPRNVSAQILRLFDGDGNLTKSKLKDMVAPDMSFRQFQFAWTLATQENHLLKKPGRKSKRRIETLL